MDKLLFGISGLPIWSGIKNINYASGINYISSIGLDANVIKLRKDLHHKYVVWVFF
ncbi:hypothetical protein JHL18_19515 [Clostridium sp. YIM B02505]|uniref:Uncharacterized protein n=1 Tax=Clostridium yunnanense TaxID=2800325 RepID=A0ABS1ETW3_9CLOT|nr:hypothetical protein [Clostridium yunnanense]